ncbi:MAG: general secretion pathway protein GspB [Steroidobacteraceae bacterium]
MSFILDALRKSEHARQKTTGPGLAEVPVALPKQRSNVWATATIALLIVNLVAIGVVLLRRAGAPAADAPATTTTAATAGQAAMSTPRMEPETTSSRTGVAPSRPAPTGRNPLAEEVGDSIDPALAAGAASVPAGPRAVTRQAAGAARRGSVVYAPIPEAQDLPYAAPEPTAAAVPATRAPASGEQRLPTADEMVARGLPVLHLDLHVYADAPAQRFIFVNSRKYREGDALQEGPLVERITPDGAVLDFRGSRFRLSQD